MVCRLAHEAKVWSKRMRVGKLAMGRRSAGLVLAVPTHGGLVEVGARSPQGGGRALHASGALRGAPVRMGSAARSRHEGKAFPCK